MQILRKLPGNAYAHLSLSPSARTALQLPQLFLFLFLADGGNLPSSSTWDPTWAPAVEVRNPNTEQASPPS